MSLPPLPPVHIYVDGVASTHFQMSLYHRPFTLNAAQPWRSSPRLRPSAHLARMPPARLDPWGRASSSSSSSSDDDKNAQSRSEDGSEAVQDALSEILMIQVRKEEVKQQIRDDVEVKKERMREIGDQITSEFGDEIRVDKLRMELASNMSLVSMGLVPYCHVWG
eukprot:gene7275-388_t